MKRMTKLLCLSAMLLLILTGAAMAEDKVIKMSTTTSTQASGLLDVLLPEFKKDTGIDVKVVAKGTGAAIRDGQDGNVDVIFVHAKAREEAFVADGWGTKRYAVMHNDFVILGPAKDPAGVKGEKDVAKALTMISKSGAAFISRGDDSGTHTKEQALWKASGLELDTKVQKIKKGDKEVEIKYTAPKGDWYMSIGQGMGKTLVFAEEKQAYTLSDRGTFIKYKYGKQPALELDILVEGDERLANPYGVIPINPKKHAHVKIGLAETFAKWLVSERGQALIANYRLEGKQLFFPDAIPGAK
jgi:tungstate transport system substrate-binding protein